MSSSFRKFLGMGPSQGKNSSNDGGWPQGNERYFGLENVGNVCYCSSILQALYFCVPFRQAVLNYPNIPSALAALNEQSSSSPSSTSPVALKTAVVLPPVTIGNSSSNGDASVSIGSGGTAVNGVNGVSDHLGDKLADMNLSSSSSGSTLPVFSNPKPVSRSYSTMTTLEYGTTTATAAAAATAPTSSSPSPALSTTTATTTTTKDSGSRLSRIRFPGRDRSKDDSSASPSQSSSGPVSVSSIASALASASGGAFMTTSTAPVPSSSSSSGPSINSAAKLGVSESMFTALKDLFELISSQKKRNGSLSPNNFILKLKKENELFRSTMHQDAHEFLNYILNVIGDDITTIERNSKSNISNNDSNGGNDSATLNGNNSNSNNNNASTFIQQLFEGTLTNETRCLTCETVTSRDESFLDLSIDVEEHSSVTSCLRQFSASEMLCHKNKFFCDVCGGLQEAEKRMKIRKLPNVLALHLKRFKFQESIGRYVKLNSRVVFPCELRLPNTASGAADADRLYTLFAVVVHLGGGPHHGHYIVLVKSMGQWLVFDDESVEPIDENDIPRYFGENPFAGSGYVLFYESADMVASTAAAMGMSGNAATPILSPSAAAAAIKRMAKNSSVYSPSRGASYTVPNGYPPAPATAPATNGLKNIAE
ncbi:cysteine proteinase [Ramicandelaber brevisporus]|nr:cysteine proteinase [Ramicandelaber brevisporus]